MSLIRLTQIAERQVVSVQATERVISLDQDGRFDLQALLAEALRNRLVSTDRGDVPGSKYRVTLASDGTITLHPITDLEADMWESGLMAKIEDSRAHPERMSPLDLDDLDLPTES
jgi:hypothetical protein